MYHTYPTTEVQSVITAQELADWIGVEATDPLLPIMGQTITGAVIEFLESELIDRERVVVYEQWPLIGTATDSALSEPDAFLVHDVVLPYARLQSVTEALAGGTATTDYRALDSLPSKLRFESIPVISDSDYPALKVTYVAGYGAIGDVPMSIKTAVLMASDFLYNNRGSCSADQALQKSGAKTILTPYKTRAILL